jgi:hypothetical protein
MSVTVESGLGSRELTGIHFEFTDTREVETGREEKNRNFLLVIPGEDPIAPGDRVIFRGQTAVVATVKPRYFRGKLCHTEARG